MISQTSLASFSKVKRITNLCGNKEWCPTQTPFILLLSGSTVLATPRLRKNVHFNIYWSKLLLLPTQEFFWQAHHVKSLKIRQISPESVIWSVWGSLSPNYIIWITHFFFLFFRKNSELLSFASINSVWLETEWVPHFFQLVFFLSLKSVHFWFQQCL